jgi:immune inhibitor A
MRNLKIFGLPLAVVLIISMLLTALMPAGALAQKSGPTDVATTGPKLWQEKDAPAYVPVARDDSGMYRSVRMPPVEMVKSQLEANGAIPLNATPEQVNAILSQWYAKAQKDAYTGPDPRALRNLEKREKALLTGQPLDDIILPTPDKDLMAVVVEFDGTDTLTRPYPDPANPGGVCVDTEFTWGPLFLNQDPPPGPRDNFRFFKPDIGVADYEEAFFGEGPDAGYGIIDHPVLGPVDLRGSTVQNYLLEMSDGVYRAGGGVLPNAVTVPHSQEFYGWARYDDNGGAGPCTSPTFSDGNYRQYPLDVIEAVREEYNDSLDCSLYDADGDHVIDVLVTIHAGYGYQEGGGEDRLSTSSSGLSTPEQICGHSTPADPADDYFVVGFNVDPEQLDVGAIQEEFEHQFGLPDLYSTDRENSNAWWGAHSSGVWGGPLGATRPVGHNLWQDYVLGWRDPLVVNYDDPAMEVTIGRARYTPEGTEDGVIVMLPPEVTEVPNNAGTGIGWWSQSGDDLDHTVYREWDLSGVTGQTIFSFDAYWDTEEDWDYGFFEVSTDGGVTWTTLPDMDGVLTDTNPNGNNLGWGLTGQGDATLRFDISAAAGLSSVWTRIRYKTDPAVTLPGFWVDNISVDGASGNLYFNDLETNFSDWTVEGWVVVPFEQTSERYYLLEWRDNNGFDKSLENPYQVYWSKTTPPQETVVDRLPVTTPGMTVTYRDMGKDFDYEVTSDMCAPPSCGTKHALIVVDSHDPAKRFNTTFPNYSGGFVGVRVSDRVQPGDSAFGHAPTAEWTAHLGFNSATGQYVDPPLEQKTWPSEAGIPAFHDSYGYYPGFFYPGVGSSVYYSYFSGSAALPAQGNYSTRITDPEGNLLPDLFGVPIGPGGLGTGNPGDDHVQYGLHVEVLSQTDEQATIKIWNTMFEFEGMVEQTGSTNPVVVGTYVDVDVMATNIGGAVADGLLVTPIDPDTMYVPGSAYGGAMPLTAEYAAQLAAAKGLTDLAALAAAAAPEDVVAVAWSGPVGTGEEVAFGFTVKVMAMSGEVQHDVAVYDGATFINDIAGSPVTIVDNSTYTRNRSRRFNVDRDTYIDGNSPNAFNGDAQTMWVGYYGQMRPLVHTRLDGIPRDSAVDLAYLYLYVYEGRGFANWATSVIPNVQAHPVSTVWMPDATNWFTPWATPGGDFGMPGPSNNLGSGKIGTWLRLDITAAAEDMLRSGFNQGFILTSDDTRGVRYGLASKENWTGYVGYIRVYFRTAN